MATKKRYHVIGLWQVWDDIPDAPHPQTCPPDALLEGYVKAYEAKPKAAKARWDAGMHGAAIRREVDESNHLGQRVVDEATWHAMLAEGGWDEGLTRRHQPNDATLADLTAYGLTGRNSCSQVRHGLRLWITDLGSMTSPRCCGRRARGRGRCLGLRRPMNGVRLRQSEPRCEAMSAPCNMVCRQGISQLKRHGRAPRDLG